MSSTLLLVVMIIQICLLLLTLSSGVAGSTWANRTTWAQRRQSMYYIKLNLNQELILYHWIKRLKSSLNWIAHSAKQIGAKHTAQLCSPSVKLETVLVPPARGHFCSCFEVKMEKYGVIKQIWKNGNYNFNLKIYILI